MTASQKLYQRIADTIAARIEEGDYPPGVRLPAERDLAEEFGVSRPTVREAMIALEIRGMVGARRGSGIYVSETPPSPGPVAELDVGAFELIEARMLFEGEAAALAATAINDAQIELLHALLAEMDRASDTPDAFDADRRFHLAIAEATGNSLIVATVERLWTIREQSPLCIHMFAQARREGVTPRVSEHQAIVDAIAAGDVQGARDAMRGHLRRVTDDLLKATELDLIRQAQASFEVQRKRVLARSAF